MFPFVCCVGAGIKNQPPYRGRRDGFVRMDGVVCVEKLARKSLENKD